GITKAVNRKVHGFLRYDVESRILDVGSGRWRHCAARSSGAGKARDPASRLTAFACYAEAYVGDVES
ncbi:MAG: hypothetical protein IKT79_02305, partial [Akkermansia sp.]|nr:hypothetical protein [Akkermansia sp.]